ncbi:MAG: permease-like cell division protein FtsX [Acidobacteriota bacterium]
MILFQNFRYFLSEALHSLWRSRARNLLSLATITISLAVTGVFLYLSLNARAVVRAWVRDIPMIFFLREGTSEAEVHRLREKFMSNPMVQRVSYVSPADALARFRTAYARFADLSAELGENPFPASFEVKLGAGASRAAMQSIVDEMRQQRSVSDVQFDEAWVKRLDASLLLVDAAGIFLGGILMLASIFTISNVIRLNIYSYQEEIEIMMLVGATLGFIRAPFLIEGAIQGLFGGALSLGALAVLLQGFLRYVAPLNPLISSFVKIQFLPFNACIAVILGGMIMGLIGSATSVGKVVRET